MQNSTDGFLSLKDQKICIRKGMSEVQTVCAAIHEIAHAKLHNTALPVPENSPLYQEVEIFDIPCSPMDGFYPRMFRKGCSDMTFAVQITTPAIPLRWKNEWS